MIEWSGASWRKCWKIWVSTVDGFNGWLSASLLLVLPFLSMAAHMVISFPPEDSVKAAPYHHSLYLMFGGFIMVGAQRETMWKTKRDEIGKE